MITCTHLVANSCVSRGIPHTTKTSAKQMDVGAFMYDLFVFCMYSSLASDPVDTTDEAHTGQRDVLHI